MAKKITTIHNSLKSKELLNHNNPAFTGALSDGLKRNISKSIGANEELSAAISSLNIDVSALTDKSMKEILVDIKGKVDPKFNLVFDEYLSKTNDEKIDVSVGDVLGLDLPLAENALLANSVLMYNASKIGGTLKLKNLEINSELPVFLNASPDQKSLMMEQWKGAKNWDESDIAKLESTVDLMRIVDDQADVVLALRNDGILKTSDMAKYNASTLVSVLEKSKVNPGEKESLEDMANDMLLRAEMEHPSAFFMQRVVERQDWLGIDEKDFPKVSGDFKMFYEKNREFDIKNEEIISLETGLLNAKIKDTKVTPTLIAELNLAQQALQLCSDTSIAAVLMAKKVNVYKASKFTHNALIRELDIDWATASEIKRKAQDLNDSVMNGYLSYREMYSNPFLREILANIKAVREVLATGVANDNNWEGIKELNGLKELNSIEDLFGSQNYCECESCRSVLSPAAYFVDLMRFIEERVLKSSNGNNGLTETTLEESNPIHLKVRRPDLWNLKLTCENTNKNVPYIEIVNKVLEAFITKHLGNSQAVQGRLRNEKPEMEFLLPYNHEWEEVRTWLSYFKIEHIDLLEYLHPSPSEAESLFIAAERLNLSPELYKFVVDDAGSGDIDKDVLLFREKSGMSAEDTSFFTKLKFWKGKLAINQIKVSGDIQLFRLEFTSSLPNWKNVMHRLFRLWKASGWNLFELDIALQTAKVSCDNLDSNAISRLASVAKLQTEMAMDVETLSGILAGVSTITSDNKSLSWDKLLPKSWLENEKVEWVKLQEGLDEKAVKVLLDLQGVFGLTSTDILACLDFLRGELTDEILFSTENLDLIFRYVQVFKWTKIATFDEFTQLLTIWGNGNIRYLNNPQSSLPSFIYFFKKLPLGLGDLIYALGKDVISTVVNNEDKSALETVEMREFVKLDSFVAPDRYGLLFNKWLGIERDVLEYFRFFLEVQDADMDVFFEDLLNDTPSDQTYIGLSNIKNKLDRLTAICGIAKIDTAMLLRLASVVSTSDVFKFGFQKWVDVSWVNQLKIFGEWISETKKIPSFDLVEFIMKMEDGSALDMAMMRGVAKWQGLSLAQVSPELVQCNSISDIQAIWDRFNWAKILGVNNGLLAKFGIGNSLDLQSDLLKNAIRAKFDDREIWASSIQDFKNILSSKLRDALCSFVIFHKGLRDKNFGFKDRESLYQYFLLDVGMGDCFTLPPVVAMTNSLQVYVHRCLMGLEISADEKTVVLLDLDEMEEWEWRKNYRVWEANRKIFLWPENYAEPSIRDNKSPEFKELEDELLQQKLSAEVVEDAYKKYIEQIMILAELRMAGAYYDKANNQIFIFGRTNKQPKEFYMRSLEFLDSGGVIWSNWEKMNVSIPSDDISAIRHNGKLHIFWTSFQRKDISSINSGNSEINQHTYDVFLNYSYKKVDGKWSAPQRVEMDYRKNSPFDPFLRIDKYENLINNANTPNPSFKSGADAVRENALKQFEQIVYKKPYPIALSDKKNLKFGYIWTDQKDALEPRYKKTTATIDAFTVSIKLRVDVVVFEFEQDLEFSLDRLDRVVSTATSYNQEEPPVNLTISPLEYKYQFGSDILILRLEFIKSNSGSFQYSLKTLGNGNNKIIFFKEPNKEVKSGSVNIFHQIDYVPVSEIEFKEEFVDMARQSTYSGSGGLSTMKILLNPEYASYYDNFSNFYVTDGSSAFTYPSLASKIQQKDMISVLTTPSNPDPNSGYELNPQNIQLLWNKISLGIESLMDTQSSQRHLVNQIDYSKSFGNYFFELFFHIPMRIADHLNASGKYKEANYWYGFIYNPTAIKDKFEQLAFPYDVNWRFAAFRNISMQKLKDMYSDPNTIEMYRRNPGNPHAIARMRLAAYQKHVVMKYLDNLLDWADNLFEQYTPESTSEARNLYSTVKTILGQKPQTTGDCLVPNDFTYNDIKDTGANEFLYNLFISPNSGTAGIMKMNSMTLAEDEEEEFVYTPNTHRAKTSSAKYVSKMNAKASAHKKAKKPFTDVKSTTVGRPKVKDMAAIRVDSRYSTLKPVKGLHRPNLSLPYFDLEKDLAFCFPHNQDFINYWDRVDDRIYKLNHCLDINGVRKVMPAYAPPIDPMLLARMVAGGLSFDEIAGALNAKLPNHRFSFLIERAKQYAGVVQNFGQSLFAAIEKKDAEELTLIRARHEVNILNLSTQLKKQQIEQAKVSLKIVQENKKGIEIRKAHFENLVNEGLTSWEIAQQVSKHVATGIKLAESVVHFSAAITYLIPQVGSPFAMKYGGQELGHSGVEFAEWAGSMAQIAEAISSSAALEAGNQRREQDWQHQVENLAQDLVGLNEQVRNAEIAVQVAELDLELHLKNIEQYEELFEFYTTKFAGFDHYTFLVRELQRLYRMAYNMANDVAIQAQAAFEFERRGVEGVMGGFVQSNNWNNERIGLLAGENLLLQLMQMEQEFYNTDKRKIEITQHFSLLQIAPEKLLELKITGEFSGFTIPEAAFDLVYPGYFRRIIKSVRISIPCIAGPYTNIGATLTLGTNKIRTRTTDDLIDFNFTGCETIATSSAQNDGGQFELNFRDERYLPFEGAGAVSSWTLSLPKSIRPFDYNSISDIVFHVSYTAEYDGVFKNEVEGNLKVALNSLNGAGLTRIFSLRYDFPREWNLLSDSNNSDDMILELRREHFPYFASVDKIKSIGSKVFTQQPDNLWVEETDNLGITKQGNMKVVIPAAVGDNSLKDLIFIVTYDCK